MVARGAGDVGCAHCTQFGATETCQVCKLLVCEKCAADWTTCNEQAARVLRLGMGWRVRDVDPKGRYALVSRALKIPRIVDLRQLRWLGSTHLVANAMGMMAKYPPRLTSDGLLVHADVSWVTNDTVFVGLRYRGMFGAPPDVVLENVDGPLGGSTCVSAVDDKYAHVTEGQRVVVVEHSQLGPQEAPQAAQTIMHGAFSRDPSFRYRAESYEPLPRKVVSAIAVDGERDLLASATWREVAIHKMIEGKLERFGYLDTGFDANITVLALTGRWLVYGTAHRLEVRPISSSGDIGKVMLRHDGAVDAFAVSRDGSYLAIGEGSDLVLHDLDRDRRVEYAEHSDKISYVRFASDDHVLISGDNDNRVVLRPRTADGYAKPVVKVALAGTP
ncbi:MAG TPA: hypothetical protein VL326_19750 [Kofleriaceae bacterium]|jgi:hypothetical protein|nr:hypothetical protein [Kofleriaceae bacterium]